MRLMCCTVLAAVGIDLDAKLVAIAAEAAAEAAAAYARVSCVIASHRPARMLTLQCCIRSNGVSSRTSFLCRDLLEFPEVCTDFDGVFVYLLPELFLHHPVVEERLWQALSIRRAVIVMFRWPMKDVVNPGSRALHEWSKHLRATASPDLPHPYFVYSFLS